MLSNRTYLQAAVWIGIGLAGAGSGFGQNTIGTGDTLKAYSTVGLNLGETLRLDVVNIGGTNGAPPDPCNVQMGFVNSAGTVVKTANATVDSGHAAFLTLTFAEGAASATSADTKVHVNYLPVVNTIPPGPCRTVSTAEVFDAVFGRTHVFLVPAESLGSALASAPNFGITGVTALDSLRVNVTNITGSNGFPPGPCVVQMGFIDAAGTTTKPVSESLGPGQSASLLINYRQAATELGSASLPARFNLRPLVTVPPGPCRVASSTELVDSLTGITTVSILPAVQSNVLPLPLSINVNTVGQ